VSTPTADLGEALRLQRVTADVDALEARRGETRCQAGKTGPVRGHGQIGEPDSTEPGHEVGHTGPHERLAPGQTHRVDSETVRDQGNPFDLLEGEDLGPGYPGDSFFRHAVDATEVATVGYRDTEVCVDAPERVDERTGRRHRERRGALR
jgi:hypothetical protein